TVITPHRFSSLPLVRRLEDRLGIGLEYGATVSLNTASTLTMLTMEQALSWSLNTEIIIVDEAACFPVHVLLDLANQTSRIVFSTTTSGYEGTGQGFRLRFEPSLSARYPNRKRLTMTQPVRWKSDDPVEAWVHRTLCLSDSTADIAFSHQEVTISPLSQDELSTSDDCLQAVSELLARAHHRTTPSDLHRIMDAPNHSLWVARAGKSIVGVCVVSREGGLSDDMVEPVFRGERRPKGHFIPETLSVHAAQKMAVKQRFWRVVRIAVDGNFRRHKVASRLLSTIEVEATRLGVDALGASFGATESLLSFWSSVGFSIVRLGVRRGRSSGLYSVLVLRPTSNEGRTLLTALRERYHQYFPECLSDGLRNLEWSVVRGLFADRDCLNENISELDADDTRRFVGRQQSFEIVSPSIKRVMTSLLSEAAENGDDTKWAIVVQKVFQHKPWDSLSIQGKAIDSRGIGHEHLRKAVEYFWNQ
ncbi:MAG: GNAT family N-acetyltransferase, partial [Bradymonadia bacterium]